MKTGRLAGRGRLLHTGRIGPKMGPKIGPKTGPRFFMSIELTPCTSLHPPQILATGLSGLYSALPRRLSPWCESSPGWHRISADDLREMPELALFLSSLQFCDAVLQVSGTKCHGHSRGPGKNARRESASCCLRCSRVDIFARSPRAAWHFNIITLEFMFQGNFIMPALLGGHNGFLIMPALWGRHTIKNACLPSFYSKI